MTTEIEDGLILQAVAREIELILQHLMDNAVKYNKDNGSIRVTVKKQAPG